MQFPAWDPVLLDIPGLPLDVRWYGLMYIVGFVFAQWVLVRLARVGFLPVHPNAAPDLIFYCVFGVMLGGRIGYAAAYDQSLLNPLKFVQIWHGGLAFHGGLAGVGVAVWLFCRRYRVSWLRAVDACALAVPVGIFAVRVANFINGELYGRITSPTTVFAMQFPGDPRAQAQLGLTGDLTMRDRELAIQVAFGKQRFADVRPSLSDVDLDGKPIDWERIEPLLDWNRVSALRTPSGDPVVPFRHPSQLYEAIGEGLVVGLVLLVLWQLTRHRPLRPGRYAIVFLLGYAVARWMLELVRQPDDFMPANVLFGMTMGQTLSTGLIVLAIGMLVWPQRRAPA